MCIKCPLFNPTPQVPLGLLEMLESSSKAVGRSILLALALKCHYSNIRMRILI